MQISTVPATLPVLSRLSPVQVWQQLLTYLLEHHYGLTLNDTPFHDDSAIHEHIEAGIKLADAVNFLVERYELIRTDRKGFTWQEQTPFLTATDKPIPDNRGDVTTRLMEHIRDNPSKDVYEDDFFSIRYFQKGTAHITFKRCDLTEKMNDIVAKHYPGMLAAI